MLLGGACTHILGQALLPKAWHGNWEGRLYIYSASGPSMELTMNLVVTPTDSAHRLGWTITYLPDDTTQMKVDRRPYELIGLRDQPNHFVIDEQNSILLDGYLLDQTLVSRFRVDQALLMITYTLQPDGQLRFEVFSGGMEPARETGQEVAEIDAVEAFKVGAYQRALLTRQE